MLIISYEIQSSTITPSNNSDKGVDFVMLFWYNISETCFILTSECQKVNSLLAKQCKLTTLTSGIVLIRSLFISHAIAL